MNTIELRPVKIDSKYAEKWNECMTDFCHLYKNGKKVSNTLYRIGGHGVNLKDSYFLILKHVESHYDDDITTDKKLKRHLAAHWCIIDNNGDEKVVFEKFASPYLCGGQIYTLKNKYYNIETGYLYCSSYTFIKSEKFLFLEKSKNIQRCFLGFTFM